MTIISTEIVQLDPDSLQPHPNNSRIHKPEHVRRIMNSIRQWGFTIPVLLDDRHMILAGHGRVRAAQELKLKKVPCIVASDWSDEQKRAYLIADNRLTEVGEWDESNLAAELSALADLDFDISILGISDPEINRLHASLESVLEDEDAPAEPDESKPAVVCEGDLWILGKHRLFCGDSTDPAAVDRLLDGVIPQLMVTDPPYGVEYDPDWRENHGLSGSGGARGKVANDDEADWREAYALFPGPVAYVWHAAVFCDTVADGLRSCDLKPRALICWAKKQLVISRGHYHHQHESCLFAVRPEVEDDCIHYFNPCWYAVREGQTASWAGDRKQSTLWHIDTGLNDTGHSTQKPVEAMRRPIRNSSIPGDRIYDPFSGSGTTFIACEQIGRICYGLEVEPMYCDVIIRRWQRVTGLQALREDGAAFDSLELVA